MTNEKKLDYLMLDSILKDKSCDYLFSLEERDFLEKKRDRIQEEFIIEQLQYLN